MSIFQKAYDWIKNIKTPVWWKELMQVVQDILLSLAQQVSLEYIKKLEDKIIEVSGLPLTPEAKFNEVFMYAKIELPDIKERYLNLLIETIVNRLKEKSKI